MDKVKITFFGIGCKIAIGKFSTEELVNFHKAAKIFATPLSEAIFDSAYFLELADKKYKRWFDLGNELKLFGLLNSYQSSIEIRINGKKQRKILISDLIGDSLLFPLYKTNIIEHQSFQQSQSNLIIVEKEIGTIANYLFETESFSIDNLHFSIQSVNIRNDLKYTILTNLNYSAKELVSKKSDTLIKERFALL